MCFYFLSIRLTLVTEDSCKKFSSVNLGSLINSNNISFSKTFDIIPFSGTGKG